MKIHDWLTRLEQTVQLDHLGRGFDLVVEPLASSRAGEVLRGEGFGHALHPVLTDLPLGFWMSASLIDVLGGATGRASAQRLIGLGLLFAPLTAAAGLAEWPTLTTTAERRVAAIHALGNTLAVLAYLASWKYRRRNKHFMGIAAALAGATIATGTGYLGGHLSFVLGAGQGARR